MTEEMRKRLEEAAKEYIEQLERRNPSTEAWNFDGAFITGAEWKDRQFKEYLEKKKEKLLLLQDDVSNQREFDLIDYRISLIEEMIVELFGED